MSRTLAWLAGVVVVIAALTAVCLPITAKAQTLAERIVACTPDVRALCAPGLADVVDRRRICRCMIANHSLLSERCRAMAPLAGLRQCAR